MSDTLINRITLAGYLFKTKYMVIESNSSSMYKGIMYFDPHRRGDSINITAWGDTADLLSTVDDGLNVMLIGVLNISSYEDKCRSCGNVLNKAWVDVTVASFRVLI